MNILMLSATFPYPPTKGGTQGRTFNLLKNIDQPITLVTLEGPDITLEDKEGLSHHVEKLLVFPRPRDVDNSMTAKLSRFARFLYGGTPPNVLFSYSQEIQRWLDDAVAKGQYSVITCEHSVNEPYIRPQWRQKLNTVIDIHSSSYKTCQNALYMGVSGNKVRDTLYLPLLRRYEKKTVSKFSTIVVTTDEDERQMRQFNPGGEVHLIPNAVDLNLFPYRHDDPGGHNLVFVGGLDYFVNIDAACFLGGEILPRVQSLYPGTTLTLVGANPSPEVQALTDLPGVTVTGRVPSIAEYLHRGTIAVIPLRSGFGMKFKTLESMAAGVPVVGSDRALEGLTVDASNLPLCALRANRVDEYVAAISRLFEDHNLRSTLSRNARDLIERNYTWQVAAAQYEKVLTRTV